MHSQWTVFTVCIPILLLCCNTMVQWKCWGLGILKEKSGVNSSIAGFKGH